MFFLPRVKSAVKGKIFMVRSNYFADECSSDACSRLPCQHGGKCVSSGEVIATSSLGTTTVEASCLCPLGYTGTHCEQRLELQVRILCESRH